jgi:hypothetical protein
MGTFAETGIVDYHLSFAEQGKQTSVCSKKRKFGVFDSIYSKHTELAVFH